MIPAIFAPAGLALNEDERKLFQDIDPYGFIVFARNVDSPDQVRDLVAELQSCVSTNPCPILIDQEGGRVARLRPPHWPEYPKGAVFGLLAQQDLDRAVRAAFLNARLIAADLHALGINVDCLPILDVPVPGSHDVIGDRAYANDPAIVTAIGRAVADGLKAGGVLPVIKHIPGHGRGGVDSHLSLPEVDVSAEELRMSDFVPFKALADLPFGMTAHILFSALDQVEPATTSATIIEQVIRKDMGFEGVLMSDDLNMEALGGSLGERAARSLAAGCDLALHCSGDLEQMREVAAALEPVSAEQSNHLINAMRGLKSPETFDSEAALAERDALLEGVI